MNILFVHQNFPAQYVHIAPELAKRGHKVFAMSIEKNKPLPGVNTVYYSPAARKDRPLHPLSGDFDTKMARAEGCASAAMAIKRNGFHPDIICAHPGWGEPLFLKDVWPGAKLLCFWEYYYRSTGGDVNFDPEFANPSVENAARIRVKNANHLLALEAADWGISPTRWQKRQFPQWAWPRISVIHDGIHTDTAKPDPSATFLIPGTDIKVKAGDEIITFVSRNLEPYRGYHIFMRSLPEILRERPKARVLIVGGDGVSYGGPPPAGTTWKQQFFDEVASDLDSSRVHFLGKLPYLDYLKVLQVSAAHVYLTYPFVLSWSLLEAMSAGCMVIGSRTPPVEEVIRHGENGLLTDFFDTGALSGTVCAALDQPGLFHPLREQARADIVAHYDLRRVCLPEHVALVEQGWE